MTKSGVRRGWWRGEEGEEDFSDVDMDVKDSKTQSLDHIDFGVNAFGIVTGRAIIKEVQDILAPAVKRSSPLHHGYDPHFSNHLEG